MFPLPKTGIPGATFPAVPSSTAASMMLGVLHQLRSTQLLPPAELQALQFRQLSELTSHSCRTVPFYANLLRQSGIKLTQPISREIWHKVPILTRQAVQEAGAALHARELPQGHGSISTATTSGSSGRPVTIRKTALAQFFWQCFVIREHEWQGRDFSALWMTILRDDLRTDPAHSNPLRRFPDWGEPLAAIYSTGPGLLLDYRVDVAEMFRIIIKEKPAYLTTFPSLLRELLRESRASGVLPQGLLEVRSTGEALSTEIRSLCGELWGTKVSEIYSAAEIGIIAVPCSEQNALHVQSEGVFLEILRDDGTPCASGEEGRVVLTPLHNFVMPLIRYELGDRATLGAPCSCGRTLPVLRTIPGRARDMITTPTGERRFPFYSHGEMMKLDAIVQHQVAQTAVNQIEIRLVVRRPLTITEETQLLSIARAGLGTAHELRIVYCKEILRQKSGKFAEFTNELNPSL